MSAGLQNRKQPVVRHGTVSEKVLGKIHFLHWFNLFTPQTPRSSCNLVRTLMAVVQWQVSKPLLKVLDLS